MTGVLAGSNRSGDLKDPAYSLPRGTLGAQMFTSLIYITAPFLWGAVGTRSVLIDEDIVKLFK